MHIEGVELYNAGQQTDLGNDVYLQHIHDLLTKTSRRTCVCSEDSDQSTLSRSQI